MKRLAGQVAVITGGSKGIGFAIARAFASEGGNVVITGRTETTLQRSAGQITEEARQCKILPVVCDIREPQSVDTLFKTVRERFGKLDILVNNAGISQPPTPLEQTTLEMWRDQIDTNLTGLYLTTRAAVPLMNRGATIINTLSAAAKQIFPNYYGYTSAKAGALGFTLSLRAELMPRGIRVTALMPGATDTELWQQIVANGEVPREHMMKTESIAQAVLYAVLLPPEANLSEILLTPILGAV